MEEKRKLSGWANIQQIILLDSKYYDDKNLYSYEEYRQIVPRNVEVPMSKPEMPGTSVIDINNFIVKKEDNYQLSNIIRDSTYARPSPVRIGMFSSIIQIPVCSFFTIAVPLFRCVGNIFQFTSFSTNSIS